MKDASNIHISQQPRFVLELLNLLLGKPMNELDHLDGKTCAAIARLVKDKFPGGKEPLPEDLSGPLLDEHSVFSSIVSIIDEYTPAIWGDSCRAHIFDFITIQSTVRNLLESKKLCVKKLKQFPFSRIPTKYVMEYIISLHFFIIFYSRLVHIIFLRVSERLVLE